MEGRCLSESHTLVVATERQKIGSDSPRNEKGSSDDHGNGVQVDCNPDADHLCIEIVEDSCMQINLCA